MDAVAVAKAVVEMCGETTPAGLAAYVVQMVRRRTPVAHAKLHTLAHPSPQPIPETVVAETVRTAALQSHSMPAPAWAQDPYLLAHKPAAFVCIPVQAAHGEVLGALYIEYPDVALDAPEQRAELTLLAQMAGAILEGLQVRTALTEQLSEKFAKDQEQEPTSIDGRMVGGFAHVIRNALTSVTFCFEVLRLTLEEPEEPNQQEALEALQGARRGVERALRVTSRITEYAQAFKVQGPQNHATPVGRSVQSLLYRLAPELRAANIQVEQEIIGTLRVNISDAHLQTLLAHLISNAQEAVSGKPPDQDRRISLFAEEKDGMGIIVVTDNGSGLSEEAQSRLFEPFFTTRGSAGTGMGLAISRKLTESYGGDLSVHGATGTGTTVRVRLPLADP